MANSPAVTPRDGVSNDNEPQRGPRGWRDSIGSGAIGSGAIATGSRGAARAPEPSLLERYAELRASGLASDRW